MFTLREAQRGRCVSGRWGRTGALGGGGGGGSGGGRVLSAGFEAVLRGVNSNRR